jgi:hypothetical protein
MKFIIFLFYFGRIFAADPQKDFMIVDSQKIENGVKYFVVGDYHKAVRVILTDLYKDGAMRVGGINPFYENDGFHTYGGVFQAQDCFFELIAMSEIQRDKSFRAKGSDKSEIFLKIIIFKDLNKNNEKLYSRIYEKHKGNLPTHFHDTLTSDDTFARLEEFEKKLYMNALREKIREANGETGKRER